MMTQPPMYPMPVQAYPQAAYYYYAPQSQAQTYPPMPPPMPTRQHIPASAFLPKDIEQRTVTRYKRASDKKKLLPKGEEQKRFLSTRRKGVVDVVTKIRALQRETPPEELKKQKNSTYTLHNRLSKLDDILSQRYGYSWAAKMDSEKVPIRVADLIGQLEVPEIAARGAKAAAARQAYLARGKVPKVSKPKPQKSESESESD